MYLQSEIEALLHQLRSNQTESSRIDGKAQLHLDKIGDRAWFIRHVAALANNVEPSFIIIGVKDKSWELIGLPEDSPLRKADDTQNRMNGLLTNKLDPNLTIQYRTFEVSDVIIGLVEVRGERAPYIVAIEDYKYGGTRTRGQPSYIYRGACYIRRGANSIIANRQSEISHIFKKVQQRMIEDKVPDDFLISNNYIDPDISAFGRHEITNTLVELQWSQEGREIEQISAQSWVSFVFYPKNGNCELDTVSLKEKLSPNQRIGRGKAWYYDIPGELLKILLYPKATPREFFSTGPRFNQQVSNQDQGITHFIRIRHSGHIEFACTHPLVYQRKGKKCFNFVMLIGYLWQLTYFARAIYSDANHFGEIEVLLNLIGTKATILADFAKSKREGWLSPFDPEALILGHGREQMSCSDPNIQVVRTFAVNNTDAKVENLVREVARDIGAYYNQDRPRCFDFHTNEFPVRDYLSRANRA